VRRSSITTSRSEATILGIERQVVHPVGLEVEDEVELVGGDVDEVRGDVLRGEGVVLASVALDQSCEDAGPVPGRATEHQMLEEVRDPGRAPRLVARADVIPHLHGDDGAAVVLQQQHAQPVVERGRQDRGGAGIGGGRRRSDGEHDDHEEHDRAAMHHALDYSPVRQAADGGSTSRRTPVARDSSPGTLGRCLTWRHTAR
jgi:hypothetical protein